MEELHYIWCEVKQVRVTGLGDDHYMYKGLPHVTVGMAR